MENTLALLLVHNKNIKGLKLDTYKTLKTIFKSKHLSKEERHRIFTTYIRNIFLCNLELWIIIKMLERNTFQRKKP